MLQRLHIKGSRIKGSRIKASCIKGPKKKGPAATFPPFSVRPAQFSMRSEGDTLNVHKSRLYTNQDIHMGGMGPYEMYTIRAVQPEIVSEKIMIPKFFSGFAWGRVGDGSSK